MVHLEGHRNLGRTRIGDFFSSFSSFLPAARIRLAGTWRRENPSSMAVLHRWNRLHIRSCPPRGTAEPAGILGHKVGAIFRYGLRIDKEIVGLGVPIGDCFPVLRHQQLLDRCGRRANGVSRSAREASRDWTDLNSNRTRQREQISGSRFICRAQVRLAAMTAVYR
ncbi:hypothetical protein BU26DRAFT_286267 [Trematosphaeria pertusa]|uniref:Uncharacterized protein n=1 Tax=Trematosphaeria pertusa TaxID=390896 RepID=A0A6A6IMC4_9PLEO|nr:uncharacterized protein BU26DRAFT_286267 [Trematosphaeria pertusa]KAF2251566.1 hypothetical protein BU26DRAFT_286267 [Trematosphaeria pertusa]